MAEKYEIRVQINGPRPPFPEVAYHLWGREVNLDSDGDSAFVADPNWTELTVRNRDGTVDDRVDVDPVTEDPLVLKVRGTSLSLVQRVAEFLRERTGGHFVEGSTTRPQQP